MESIIRCFTWCLSDINLCLSSNLYSINSPTYTIGDSLCKFYLQFSFDKQANMLSVLLCRCRDDGPTQVKVNFSLSLKTVGGHILHSSENTLSFPKDCNKGFTTTMTKEALLEQLENDHEKDTLIVTCESTLLQPSFTHLNEDIGALSADLLELQNEGSCANAYIVASDGVSIPVHKGIVHARSPVLERRFRNGDRWYDKRFPADVVNAMVEFLYSGDISKVDLDKLCIKKLYDCANCYKISDLIKLLTARKTYMTSLVNRKTEVHTLQFPNFTNLCESRHSIEHHRIKMEFNSDIEMNVKMLFEPYQKYGKIILETSFWNLINVKSLFVRLFILDHSNTPRNVDEIPLELDSERLKFYLEYESEKLFSGRSLILPKNILTLQYELMFQLSGELHISDPDVIDEAECGLGNHQESTSLIKSMESLLKSKQFADALLEPPSVNQPSNSIPAWKISVHKSILSARSPVFKDMFRTSQKVTVDLPECVVNILLYYVYTGVLLAVQPRTLDLLHKAAEIYGINPLKRACEKVVAKVTLDTKNVYPIYSIAFRGKRDELQKSCKDFVMQNKDIIFGSFRWERLRKLNKHACDEIKKSISVKS